jgi:hypothetical protein
LPFQFGGILRFEPSFGMPDGATRTRKYLPPCTVRRGCSDEALDAQEGFG